MRLSTTLMSAAALLAATPASAAAFLSTFIGPNSDSATQTCSGTGPKSGSSTVHAAASCFRADVGTASGEAVAAPGHIGAAAHADSHNGDSLVAKIGSAAIYDDFLTFTSTDPTATTATIVANLLLDGTMEAGGPVAGAFLFAGLSLNGQDFAARFSLPASGPGFDGNFVLTGGTIGALTNASLRTTGVVVPLNSPVHLTMRLELTSAASGPGSHAAAAFGLNSFKFAATPFTVADGVTVSAGDYIVNDRFIDPLAPANGVPEPAAWALMIAGFGLAGATLRRRRATVT